jgi:hypothetical protein
MEKGEGGVLGEAAFKVSNDKIRTPECVTSVDAMTGITDKCEAHDSGVYRIVTCASTSSVTMTFLAVAAAVLALSF